MAPENIIEHLAHVQQQESIAAKTAALVLRACSAEGSRRVALCLRDQAIAYGGGRVSEAEVRAMLGTIEHTHLYAVLDALAARDAAALLRESAALAEFAPDYDGALAELISLLHRIALAQVIPAAVEGEPDAAEIARLAAQMGAEDVQLFYQIGLIGRRDLPLAPTARTGFEMVLLRMLAFIPAASTNEPTDAQTPGPAAAPRGSAVAKGVRGAPAPAPRAAAPARRASLAHTPAPTRNARVAAA